MGIEDDIEELKRCYATGAEARAVLGKNLQQLRANIELVDDFRASTQRKLNNLIADFEGALKRIEHLETASAHDYGLDLRVDRLEKRVGFIQEKKSTFPGRRIVLNANSYTGETVRLWLPDADPAGEIYVCAKAFRKLFGFVPGDYTEIVLKFVERRDL